MTYSQYRKARKLVHKCCNYNNGNCIALDKDDECVCVQSISYTLLCRWFRIAVLPLDRPLETELLYWGSMKRCVVCGQPFLPGSNYRRVLECVQQTLTYVRLFRDDFTLEMLLQDEASRKAELAQKRKALSGAQKRMEDLDSIIQRLYEDSVLGKLSDMRFQKLSAQYEICKLQESADIRHLFGFFGNLFFQRSR